MAILQPIIDLVELCAKHGVENAILCPGSRSAAITMAFARNPKVKCYSISDERSAGFIALGIALKTKKTVAIVCTSGSAVYNFAPAVAEAFFQQVPLLVITADRPLEWIHQNDGQTIYQQEIFGKNCKKSYNLLADFAHLDTNLYFQRTINEAINLSQTSPKGPIHINVPIREPFYPIESEKFAPSENLQLVRFIETDKKVKLENSYDLLDEFKSSEKILIAVGQLPYDEELNKILEKFQNELGVTVLADVISNIRINHISNHDSFLAIDNEKFKPDLLITLGQSFISKSFKKYFQKHKVKSHWHLQKSNQLIDPLQSISTLINIEPKVFFENLFEDIDNQQFKQGEDDEIRKSDYFNEFKMESNLAQKRLYNFINQYSSFSEFLAYHTCIEHLPENVDLHLANSMAIRYVNLLPFDYAKNIEIFSNRGTSGIDGCLSTALGASLKTDSLVYLFIGDMAFLYDRNALWNNYLPGNLRLIVFNNAGGGIFRLIDGPSKQPELEEFFETKQNNSAKATIIEANFDYYSANSEIEIIEKMKFLAINDGKSKCLEIFTEGEFNQKVFKEYLAFVKK